MILLSVLSVLVGLVAFDNTRTFAIYDDVAFGTAVPDVVVYDKVFMPENEVPEAEETAEESAVEPETEEAAEEATEEVETEASDDFVEEPVAEEEYVDSGMYLSSEPIAPSYDGGGYVNANVDGTWVAGSDFAWMGVYYDSGSGYSYTYYSEKVLPGGGLSIPGRHVGDEGYVMDGNGNLCLASDDLSFGTVVSVPFGTGTAVVYDCGSGYGNLDVYVSW